LIKALVFDFDGLILETEGAIHRSWTEVYQAHGQELPFDRWIQTVGSSNASFDPRAHLEERLGRPLTPDVLDRRIRRRSEIIEAQPVLPGVVELSESARAAGLAVGVASSSTREWVEGHLRRLGIADRFDCIRGRNDVTQVKPAPDLYIAALGCLGVRATEAIALEDSPNGIAAAKAAGMWCVAVPNVITAGLDLTGADLRLESLRGVGLAELARTMGLKISGDMKAKAE
jgi:HAD superfamily hydrolase (TIGR01509 family)